MHIDNGETWRRVARAGAGGLRRVAGNAWPLLQGTAAATAAWVIARRLGDHPDPFFAPIAAVVALNASRGERGSNALRLLVGVVVGIVAAELAIGVSGAGYGTLAWPRSPRWRWPSRWAAPGSWLHRQPPVPSSPSPWPTAGPGPSGWSTPWSAPGWRSCSRRSCSRRSRSRCCAVPRQRRL